MIKAIKKKKPKDFSIFMSSVLSMEADFPTLSLFPSSLLLVAIGFFSSIVRIVHPPSAIL